MKVVVANQDRRKTRRKHVQFPAWVESEHKDLLDCVVVDMTVNGARLRAANVALPDEFTLRLDDKSSLTRRCKVTWRRGFSVGLKFVQGSPDARQIPNSEAVKTKK
jgi:PilZ domain